MPPDPPTSPLPYAEQTTPVPRQRRSPAHWLILLLAWVVGLVFWALYLALIGWLICRFLA